MIHSLLIVLMSSALASCSSLFCQDSSECNEGSKHCQDPSGRLWCCKKKAVICNGNNECTFFVPFLPFIQLRPGTTGFESTFAAEMMHPKSKYSSHKSKFGFSTLLRYHCESPDSPKTVTPLEVIASLLDAPNYEKVNASDINCPGREQRCPPENTCCLIGVEKYGCCRYTRAVCCPDLIHCCPADTECNVETMECTTKLASRKMELLR